MTPPERLKYFIDTYGLSTSYLSKILNIPTGNLNKYYGSGKKSVLGARFVNILQKEVSLNPEWYLEGVGEPKLNVEQNIVELKEPINNDNLIQIMNLPVYDLPAHALAGAGFNFEDLPFSYKPLYIGMNIDMSSVRIFRVVGDSMIDAHITPNALVFVDIKASPYNGVEVLANHNGTLIIKHYEAENGKTTLYSRNGHKTEYPIAEHDCLNIIGVVKAVLQYR